MRTEVRRDTKRPGRLRQQRRQARRDSTFSASRASYSAGVGDPSCVLRKLQRRQGECSRTVESQRADGRLVISGQHGKWRAEPRLAASI